MIARGLVTLQSARVGASAQFTEAGYAALCTLARDRRALNSPIYVRSSGWSRRRSRIRNIHRVGDKAVGKAVGSRSVLRTTRMSSLLPWIRAAKAGGSRKRPAAAAKIAPASAPVGMQLHTAAGARK